jgi:hypothetical protein
MGIFKIIVLRLDAATNTRVHPGFDNTVVVVVVGVGCAMAQQGQA